MNKKCNQILLDGCQELKINLPEKSFEMLKTYLQLYMEWNAKTNLSSIRSEEEVVVRHFLDSLAPVPMLMKQDIIHSKVKLIDLGSGGGFPGMVLKIINPAWHIDLAEVSKKKICFLKELILNLALNEVEIVDSSVGKVNQQYDIIITRAFSSLKKILKEARIYLKKGWIIAYKGKMQKLEEEMEELTAKQQNRVQIERIQSPFLNEERHIAIIKYG